MVDSALSALRQSIIYSSRRLVSPSVSRPAGHQSAWVSHSWLRQLGSSSALDPRARGAFGRDHSRRVALTRTLVSASGWLAPASQPPSLKVRALPGTRELCLARLLAFVIGTDTEYGLIVWCLLAARPKFLVLWSLFLKECQSCALRCVVLVSRARKK